MASRQPSVVTSSIAQEVLLGLSAAPKRLPPKLFYDDEGSRLFELITETPEYYPTRTERGIFERYVYDIAVHAGNNLTLVELGAGSARKTRLLIQALLRRQLRLDFHPVDVSRAALAAAVANLNGDFSNLCIHPIAVDFSRHLPQLSDLPGRKLVLFLGSTIGNFEPEEAAAFLVRVRESLTPGDALLLGVDMQKEAAILHAAYNDSQGVTECFNKNILAHINRELGGGFDLDSFRHVAFWNQAMSRIEMHLESRVEQSVWVRALGRTFHFLADERIHTENSYKFSPDSISSLLLEAGLKLERTWTDPRGWFSEVLARV